MHRRPSVTTTPLANQSKHNFQSMLLNTPQCRWNWHRGETFYFGFEKMTFRMRETIMIYQMAVAIFAGLVVAGAAVAQSSTPSSEKQETSCTTSSATTSGSAGKPMEVRTECPPDSKSR